MTRNGLVACGQGPNRRCRHEANADEVDAAARLGSVKNLMELDGYEFEDLIPQLFRSIPEFDDVRKTRSARRRRHRRRRVNKRNSPAAVSSSKPSATPPATRSRRRSQGMIGSISQREFHKGMVITTSGYTSPAREEASAPGHRALRRRAAPLAAEPPPAPRVHHHRHGPSQATDPEPAQPEQAIIGSEAASMASARHMGFRATLEASTLTPVL